MIIILMFALLLAVIWIRLLGKEIVHLRQELDWLSRQVIDALKKMDRFERSSKLPTDSVDKSVGK